MTEWNNRNRLRAIAADAMRAHGLVTAFPPEVLAQAAREQAAPLPADGSIRDLRSLLWCSIDNDSTRDLDQLSVAETLAGGAVKLRVAIADVDALVPRDSPADRHAAINTTSVYTPAVVFPMLPERFSTDLTSLADHRDRLAVVAELTVAADGTLGDTSVFRAVVRNQAKLAYDAIDAWLMGQAPLPAAAAAVSGMDEQLRIQDRVARKLDGVRREHGALDLATVELETTFDGDTLSELRSTSPSRAKSLIENLMVAVNGTIARFLDSSGFPSIRRMVRAPQRWDRIVAIAAETGDVLPSSPDAAALARYLVKRRAADPVRFPDLSHTIVRLLGSGEYVLDLPGGDPPGHFGLAVKDYAHSTAPNRRYPDLLTQRLVKAAIARRPVPYALDELERLAAHCTAQEDEAAKVERQVRKSAAAMLIAGRVGQEFDAVVTGASPKGTFVRTLVLPIEGKLVRDERGLDVGDRVRVRLTDVNVERGYIDFVRAG